MNACNAMTILNATTMEYAPALHDKGNEKKTISPEPWERIY